MNFLLINSDLKKVEKTTGHPGLGTEHLPGALCSVGATGGRRRRGQQRMRWLDGNTDSMDMSFE